MNVNNFKEEFSQLLLKYSLFNPTRNNSTPDVQTFLTNKEIVEAVRESLLATLNISFKNVNTENFKTPANEIVITTPNAPDITKVKYDANDGLSIRDQSLKSNVSLRIDTADMDTSETETTPIAVDVNPNTTSDTSNVDRLSLGSVIEKVTQEQQTFREALQNELSKLAKTQRNAMYKIIEDARTDALRVIDKIEDIRDLLAPELKPNRRLSSMMELPPPNSQTRHSTDGPSSNLRVTQRRSIQATRRSLSSQQKRSDTAVTPTSRLRAPPSSPSGSSSTSPSSHKAKSFEKLDGRSRSISMSMSALPTSAKSPCKKNLKYAHVQSTIPKPTPALKRKAV